MRVLLRVLCVALFLILAGAAAANPIAVKTAKVFKERAHVTITAEREHATVAGSFRYRQEEGAPSGRDERMFQFAVPVLVPRREFGPPSQEEMWSTFDRQKSFGVALQVQYSAGGPHQTIRSCRIAGPREWSVELPVNLAQGIDVIMCFESVVADSRELARGLALELDYRQYHVRARASGRMNLVYVPLFEERGGAAIDTVSRPADYVVEVRAAPGVTLRLVSANKVASNSSTLVRIVARHAEPIVVEVE